MLCKTDKLISIFLIGIIIIIIIYCNMLYSNLSNHYDEPVKYITQEQFLEKYDLYYNSDMNNTKKYIKIFRTENLAFFDAEIGLYGIMLTNENGNYLDANSCVPYVDFQHEYFKYELKSVPAYRSKKPDLDDGGYDLDIKIVDRIINNSAFFSANIFFVVEYDIALKYGMDKHDLQMAGFNVNGDVAAVLDTDIHLKADLNQYGD